jgi:hypothetical protein
VRRVNKNRRLALQKAWRYVSSNSFRDFSREPAMTQNPSDPMLSYASTPEGIREIAGRQRVLILCILAGILILLGLIAGQRTLPPVVQLVLLLAYYGSAIAGTVFVFLLATKIYGTGIGILLGILTLIPCIGLIVLLIVNGKTTAILKQNGVKVGFLGARVPDHLV